VAAAVVLVLGYAFFKPVNVERLQELQIVPLMNMLLENSQAAAQPLLPSYWLSTCIISLSYGLWQQLTFFTLVILSNCFLAMWSVLYLSGRIFYEDTSLVQDRILHGSALRSKTQIRWAARTGLWFSRLLVGAKDGIRALVAKDWTVFWRDPGQWSQFAIFFGLLGFYFLNLRSLHQPNLMDRFWISIIAFLNLTSLALILATLTTRFIYPQFSLEGRHIWLINMAPISLRQVMMGKFWASALSSGLLTVLLMMISFKSLRLELFMRCLIAYTIVLLSLGLSSLAISLGVLFPNLRQENPARIVSGFGGTLCLVLSLAYIVLVVLIEAIPVHMYYVHGHGMNFEFASVLGLVYIIVTAVNALVTIIPLKLAAHKLRTLEF
jgi:ABC-2 type transport system permease protein